MLSVSKPVVRMTLRPGDLYPWRPLSAPAGRRRRTFATTPPARLKSSELKVSSNSDASRVLAEATQLLDDGHWRLCDQGEGLEREFRFKTFKATWDFMNDVAAECKAQRHHPEWTNVFTRTHIKWTTHSPKGLSAKDTHMAQFCDDVATRRGELLSASQDGDAAPETPKV
ncbi:hypothetical protein LTR29_017471 [Friedmanniomyces endolithicus]|uniref:4a-hydroxytetrahydrobiopterin dehydratase n=1 Tax=Friedmanniomyces endolithicus TaxID=329885 RepID=A0A4U0UKL7_9PEZI|nr:hypothetical protein LTS09_013636 [Friedmanniomyces endolithicus]KAK0304694.1 hypothetical protein LTR01_007193 [Friedmanniomyces endolithicus]KAK0824913.1 hypothetical protein LTR73_007466 [Friedmanniomyces endolithicus]KAK0928244.1 hypothetical protein LTR29_017471 [Friedmanniomyces endolithicus]TKA36258.1 hypothetical protein B0A54_13192 [Friedmanniomyces endolithicus]